VNIKRYSSIDQLRFIAALSVAISHFMISNNGYDLNLEIISSISVEVFFIISGFVLAPQIIKILENNSIKNYRIFLIRRWYRTIPLYVLSLILTSIILNKFFTIDFLKYLLFLQNLIFIWLENDYFSISWSLAVEEWFYILFPLFLIFFFKFKKTIEKKTIINASILFILLIFLIRLFFASENNWGSDVRRIVLYRLDSIVYGFILFFFKDKFKPVFLYKIILIILFLIFSLLIFNILYMNASKDYNFYKVSFHFIVAIWGSILVIIFYIFDEKYISKNMIRFNMFLGKISYSIYLFHLLIIFIISTISASLLVKIIIYLILQLAISILLYYYFEEPILKARPHFN